jgi:hypothetical protein
VLVPGAARAATFIYTANLGSATGQIDMSVADDSQSGVSLRNLIIGGFPPGVTLSGITAAQPNGSTGPCATITSPTAGIEIQCTPQAGSVGPGQKFFVTFTTIPALSPGTPFFIQTTDSNGATEAGSVRLTGTGATPSPPSSPSPKVCNNAQFTLPISALHKPHKFSAPKFFQHCPNANQLGKVSWTVKGPGSIVQTHTGPDWNWVPQQPGTFHFDVTATTSSGGTAEAVETVVIGGATTGTTHPPSTSKLNHTCTAQPHKTCDLTASGRFVWLAGPYKGAPLTVVDTTTGKHFAASTTTTFTVTPGDHLRLFNKSGTPVMLSTGTSPASPPSTSASGSLTLSGCPDVTQGQSEAVTATLTPPRAGQSLTFDWRFPARPDVMHHSPTNNEGQATDSIGTPPPAGQASVTVSVTLDGKVIVSNVCMFHVNAP